MARTTKQDKVRELQRALFRAAKADPGRRFHALYDKVYRRDVLERAWELVRANKGAAGIDRQTITDVEQYGIDRLLAELAADLKDGSYRPLAARRVFIPKPGSPTEQRPLSIPAVRDRIVQAASERLGSAATAGEGCSEPGVRLHSRPVFWRDLPPTPRSAGGGWIQSLRSGSPRLPSVRVARRGVARAAVRSPRLPAQTRVVRIAACEPRPLSVVD